MNLKKIIQQDINFSLKKKKELNSLNGEKNTECSLNTRSVEKNAKCSLNVLVLRQLLAVVLNQEKEKRFKLGQGEDIHLEDEEVIKAIFSEVKKRKEAISLYIKGDRPELVEKEKKELEILKRYLPEQLSEKEIKKLAKEIIVKNNAREIKDMGKVMSELMLKLQGRADNSLVGKIVKELLTQA